MARRDDAPRDLLFGLLALQNGMVTRDQLVIAFTVWTATPGKPLADLMAEQGALLPEHRPLLDALADAHLELHGGDPERSLAALDVNRSTREGLANAGGPVVEATLAHVGSGSDGGGDRTATYAVGTAAAGGQRFRVLRPHARGGLGAVFVALDSELNREVALKRILDAHADDPVSRQRFLVEAEITGGLENPGVVPVYGLGTYDGGRPYYAMRFVRGDSLKEAIERFHQGASKADPGRRSLDLRKLLRRFVDVCNAIEYAHSRGVLHRDLKPGNVIVGQHGETLVVDWGLAKPLGRAETDGDGAERALMPSSASGSAETLPGQALGTPAYMSPEQARGDLGALGPRSDTYALGATLYCLLTGRPPFEGDVADVLRAVERGEFAPPRRLNPAIDPALQAVCLKAMATAPGDRYGSARTLAEEVERWMADEPVSAWREPLHRRARRWARRNRTIVVAAGVLAGVGVAALAIGTVLIDRQKAVAEANYRRAEANFRLARGAVDDMYTQVAEKWLAQESAMEPLQREFLLKALRFYDRFAREPGSSAETRREAGKAARRAAEIHHRLGEHAAAAAAFDRAVATLGGLPGDDLAAYELAVTHNRRGWFRWVVGQDPDADYDRAAALCASLAGGAAPADGVSRETARTESSRGITFLARGRYTEAEAAHRRCLVLRGEGEGSERTHGHLGTVLKAVGRYREALDEMGRAVALCEAKLAGAPHDPILRMDLVHHLDERANLLAALGRAGEAEADLVRATGVAERLAAEFPGTIPYQDLHSTTRRDLANLRKDSGKDADARRDYERAIAVAEELMRRNPDVPAHRRSLAVHRSNLGSLLHGIGRPDEAGREFAAARDLAEALAADFPDRLDYRLLRARHRLNVASLQRATARWAEAAHGLDQVIADLEALRAEFPLVLEIRSLLIEALDGRGSVLRLLGRRPEAETSFETAAGLAEALAGDFPEVPNYHVQAAATLTHLGQQALDRREPARARGDQERAIGHVEAALALNPGSVVYRGSLLQNLSILLQAQAQEGDAAGVEATARRIEGLAATSRQHYNAACYLCLAVQAADPARRDGGPAPWTADLLDRAVAQLRLALEGGYRNRQLIANDPDLDPLRGRDDFRLLMMDLAMPADPFAAVR